MAARVSPSRSSAVKDSSTPPDRPRRTAAAITPRVTTARPPSNNSSGLSVIPSMASWLPLPTPSPSPVPVPFPPVDSLAGSPPDGVPGLSAPSSINNSSNRTQPTARAPATTTCTSPLSASSGWRNSPYVAVAASKTSTPKTKYMKKSNRGGVMPVPVAGSSSGSPTPVSPPVSSTGADSVDAASATTINATSPSTA